MGYKDIIIAEAKLYADGQYQSKVAVYVIQSLKGLSSNHVLLNETLPPEITENTTWETQNVSGGRGSLLLTFANGIHFDNEVTFTCVLGIPDN